ncbi:HAD-IA family hydrolase [Herbaspirillum lusitanum]|uniref:HAD-IA family hydrolase n=1 Tax=Herbaspirillum lusitanum TaxID=213312 RepID=UPI000312AE4D|nr:HAD-IA family hydrolase [Herbaspirillum lusitanum]
MSNNEFENPAAQPPKPAEPVPPTTGTATAVAAEEKKGGWERDVLEKLALFAVKEQRARRRWSIFFKIAGLAVFVFVIWSAFNYTKSESEPVGTHTALVEISGTIEAEGRGSAAAVIPALDKAFAADDSLGVILKINSPGGSPVQAGMINDEIVRLRKEYPKKPLYVVVEEMCASGGYYIAAAADKIYVNKASIVGSIGVLMDGFGFTGLMDKVGVERRLLTAGENKGFLDPFSAQNPKQKEYAQQMLNEIHQQFIDVVRKGRGQRLKETPETFATRCADETFSKPHPAMLQELTRELGQEMGRTLMIGDTTHDLQMALNAGAAGVAVEFGAHPVEQLQALNPLYSAGSIKVLHQWLNDNA